MKYSFALMVLIVASVFYAGCGDDDSNDTDNGDDGSPTATVEATEEPVQRREAIAALRTYLSETGIEGSTGELTDPVDCIAQAEADAEGDFCIHEPSHYAPALALILVSESDEPNREGWQVRLVLEDESWQVVDAVKFDPE